MFEFLDDPQTIPQPNYDQIVKLGRRMHFRKRAPGAVIVALVLAVPLITALRDESPQRQTASRVHSTGGSLTTLLGGGGVDPTQQDQTTLRPSSEWRVPQTTIFLNPRSSTTSSTMVTHYYDFTAALQPAFDTNISGTAGMYRSYGTNSDDFATVRMSGAKPGTALKFILRNTWTSGSSPQPDELICTFVTDQNGSGGCTAKNNARSDVAVLKDTNDSTVAFGGFIATFGAPPSTVPTSSSESKIPLNMQTTTTATR